MVVHSLAYGQRAEKSIAQLSRRTGGKTFFYSGRKDSTALIDGLAATVLTEGPSLKANVPISVSSALTKYDHDAGDAASAATAAAAAAADDDDGDDGDVDCFHLALFSALEQTHCDLVACDVSK